MYITQKIEEYCEHHRGAGVAIGEFVLRERENLSRYTMQQIAEKTYTSQPTLVRTAQKWGYHGWNDFVRAYRDECLYMKKHAASVDPNFPFTAQDDPAQISENLCSLLHESLNETVELLDLPQLMRATDILLASQKILVLGMAPNSILGELFQRKMLTIRRTVIVPQQGSYHYDVAALTPQDCAIAVSYSGDNAERYPMSFLNLLQAKQVPIIGITSAGDNLIRKSADCTLTMASRERLYSKISTFATEQSLQYLFDLLFSCCFAANYSQNMDYKTGVSREREAVRKTALRDIMEER